jgi:hypothetical protein
LTTKGPAKRHATAGPDFEGSHVQPIEHILEEAFDAAGFVLLDTDGMLLLRAEDEDALEARVQRQDDPDPHYLIVRGKHPLDVDEVWRMVRRAERWLRPPKRKLRY